MKVFVQGLDKIPKNSIVLQLDDEQLIRLLQIGIKCNQMLGTTPEETQVVRELQYAHNEYASGRGGKSQSFIEAAWKVFPRKEKES